MDRFDTADAFQAPVWRSSGSNEVTAVSDLHPPPRGPRARPRRRLPATPACVIVCALSACAASVEPLLAAHGRGDFVVTCGGPEGWAACERTAAEWCNDRYRITDRREQGMRLSGECRPFQRYE